MSGIKFKGYETNLFMPQFIVTQSVVHQIHMLSNSQL